MKRAACHGPTICQNSYTSNSTFDRRADAAGLKTRIGCHSFRATGITAYLDNGGTLENAQLRTTKLYDRTGDEITLDEVERIAI
jgi:hypothetical protein